MTHRAYESEPIYYVTQVQVNISLVHNSAMNKQQSITKLKPRFLLIECLTYCQFGAKEQSLLNSFYWN